MKAETETVFLLKYEKEAGRQQEVAFVCKCNFRINLPAKWGTLSYLQRE